MKAANRSIVAEIYQQSQNNIANIRLHEACSFRMAGYREKIGRDRPIKAELFHDNGKDAYRLAFWRAVLSCSRKVLGFVPYWATKAR